jgi:urease accessory protein
VPSAVRDFDQAAPSEPAHRLGTVGLLDLTLARLAGATRVTSQFHRTPLYIFRPIYLDEQQPDMAFIFLQQSGDGLVQGDRCRIDVAAEEKARVHLTTQGASKVYGMQSGFASQIVNISAAHGSVLEYLPEPVIPFRHSRFYGETTLTVDPDATVLFAETLLPGRVAAGECHDYDIYWANTRIRRPQGELLVSDTLAFGHSAGRADTPGRLGPNPVHATFFALAGAAAVPRLYEVITQTLTDCVDVVAGATVLPQECGVAARILGPTSTTVRTAIHTTWQATRMHLLGAPAPDLRKG